MEWIKVTDRLPEIDKSDDWNLRHGISKDVWTYSKFGRREGRFFHTAEIWTVNGVTSSDGIEVTHWMPLPEPPTE